VLTSLGLRSENSFTRPSGSPAPRTNFFTNRESSRTMEQNPSPRTRVQEDTPSGLNLGAGRSRYLFCGLICNLSHLIVSEL
jgi:hypothetical protein